MKSIALRAKALKFAEGVICGLTEYDAALTAGYAEGGSAKQAVFRYSKDLKVQEYIARSLAIREDVRRRKVEVDDVWVTEQFKEIYARCCAGQRVMEYDREAGRMVPVTDEEGNGVWTFDSTGANRAMENIAKHIGYYATDNKQRRSVIKVGIVVSNHNYNNEPQTEDGETVDADE